MQILEENEGWVVGGELSQELPYLAKEGGLVGDPLQLAPDKGGRGRGQAWIAPASLEQVKPRAVGRGIAEVVAGTGQDAPAEGTRVADQVTGQRGLADTCFAAEKDEPAMTAASRGQLRA